MIVAKEVEEKLIRNKKSRGIMVGHCASYIGQVVDNMLCTGRKARGEGGRAQGRTLGT